MVPQKILFLYLHYGEGHLSSSKTLASYLSNKYGKNTNCVFVDGMGESKLVKYMFEDSWRLSLKGLGVIPTLSYALNLQSGISNTSTKIFTLFVKSYLKEVFLREKPDKIIIMHGLMTCPAEVALDELGLKVPIIVVITDPFTLFPFWLTGKNVHYILFSDEAKRAALKKHINKKRITQLPYFVNEKYSKRLSSKDCLKIRKKLGFSEDKKLILILGGGEGIKNGKALFKTILTRALKHSSNVDLAIVCGRNIDLKSYCDKLAHKYSGEVNIKVYGFVDFIYELINVCDVVVTQAGPATVMEILLLNKIPIITSYVWGQEKGNVAFVVKNNVGYYQSTVSKIPLLILELLNDDTLVRKLHANITNLKLKNGTKQTAEFIYNYT